MLHERKTLEGANAGRFFAAMSIVVFHLIGIPRLSIPTYLSFVTNYFGQGVPLFYVLSAFALCYGYFGRLNSSASIGQFYLRRFFRIAPLFYFMMLVYNAYVWTFYGSLVSLADLIASMSFTFNLIPGRSLGFVWASWSIGVEMVFYLTFPLLLALINSLPRALVAFALAVVLMTAWTNAFEGATGDMAVFARFSIMSYLQCFAGGILAYFLWRQISWTTALYRFVITVAFAALVAMVYAKVGNAVAWAVALSALAIGMSFDRFAVRQLAWIAAIGETSFSLYLWHPFVIICLDRAGLYRTIYAALPGSLLALLASWLLTLAILIPLARLSYAWIELRLGIGLRKGFVSLISHHPDYAPRRQVDAP